MTSRRTSVSDLFGLACAALTVVALAGCGDSAAPQATVTAPPRRPSAPPPPPGPAITPVAELMAQLGIDKRVSLPENQAPPTDAQRRAILEFFDGFARGDATAVKTMLSHLDGEELDRLVDSGVWSTATSQIMQIDIQTGRSPDGRDCTLAIFYLDEQAAGDEFQPQLWYYTVDAGGAATFDAVESPPDLIDRLSGSDWITAWFAILEEELALAEKPDEEFVVPQKDFTEQAVAVGGGGGPSSPSVAPGGPSRGPTAPPPGVNPGKRRKGPKRTPPGKGR